MKIFDENTWWGEGIEEGGKEERGKRREEGKERVKKGREEKWIWLWQEDSRSMGSVNWLEKNASDRTFPVVQWTRIYLPVQGTQLWSQVREDSTYCRAIRQSATTTKPAHSRAWEPQLRSLWAAATEAQVTWSKQVTTTEPACYWSPCTQSLCFITREARTQLESSPHSPQLEKSRAQLDKTQCKQR